MAYAAAAAAGGGDAAAAAREAGGLRIARTLHELVNGGAGVPALLGLRSPLLVENLFGRGAAS